ncbi:DUF2264 domain-containing protein [Microbacterium sp.]|uniref:DUF2264 domain-containing protein n=1 Tax=Microbacterium sp. TaxID=51671 RepID=UPI0028AD0D82|nr:DUF2264 domain-containing protein [Microbacterium sp.]
MPATAPAWMPPADPLSAPYTGYTRAHWVAAADRILDAARQRSTHGGAMVDFAVRPGAVDAAAGSPMDRLEGFARTFLLAALRIAGDPAGTEGTAPLIAHYAEAVQHAVAQRIWPEITDHSQATVEAASIAIALHLTRDTVWAALDDATRDGVLTWFAQARGTWCADNNHVLLGATLAAFTHADGFADARDTVENALDRMDDWHRADGWYTDGDGRRFDHYNAFAFHWYPFFIDEMMGAGFDDRRALHRERLRAFVDGYQHLFDARCAPVFQGRSLIYRWATAAPFWMARREGLQVLDASRTRRLTSGILKHFVDGGSVDTGVLSLGWQREPIPSMVQSYSGPGSPYWAAKGFLGLALPADDPVWTATETALQIEQHDVRRVLDGPRWLIDARRDDGIVRLHNFGSDGHPTRDDPLYRRMQFTSATRPVSGGDVRDSDLTIEGASHRAATRVTVGARGGAVTRTLDAGGRHVVSRVATKIVGDATLHVGRLTGAVGLTGRVSGAALVGGQGGTDAVTAPVPSAAATANRLISSVRLLGAWATHPSDAPRRVALTPEPVVDEIHDGADALACPAVRLGPLPADVVIVWQTSLCTAPPPAIGVRDLAVLDDHVTVTADDERLVFRWSLAEPFAADVEAQLIRQP